MNAVSRNFVKLLHKQFNNVSVCAALGTKISSVSFKSALSLENIYPTSSLKLTTPTLISNKTEGFSGFIPIEDLNITYSRSSGPGGQHVNCINTKVDLRFNILEAKWIDDSVKQRLIDLNKTKVNKEGYLVLKSDLTRSQQLNLADCLEKLRTLVRAAYTPESKEPSAETVEKLRRRHEKATRIRLMEKRKHSALKSDRQSPVVDL